MSVTEFIIKSFNPISLSEMDKVKLMNRVDTKFICSFDLIPLILFENNKYDKVSEVNNQCNCFVKTYIPVSDQYKDKFQEFLGKKFI